MGLEDFRFFTDSIRRCPNVPWDIAPEHLKAIDEKVNAVVRETIVNTSQRIVEESALVCRIAEDLFKLAEPRYWPDYETREERELNNFAQNSGKGAENVKKRKEEIEKYAQEGTFPIITRSGAFYLVVIENKYWRYEHRRLMSPVGVALFNNDATPLNVVYLLHNNHFFEDLLGKNNENYNFEFITNVFRKKNTRDYKSSAFMNELKSMRLDSRSIKELENTGVSMKRVNVKHHVPEPVYCSSDLALRCTTFVCGGNYVAGYSTKHSFADKFPYFPRQEQHKGYPILVTQ